MPTLDQIKVGQHARVTGYKKENPSILQRISEMGLIRGSEVKVVRFAPLGDPMEIVIRGYQLSLRLSEAALVEVESL